jgi:hypothetical protein
MEYTNSEEKTNQNSKSQYIQICLSLKRNFFLRKKEKFKLFFLLDRIGWIVCWSWDVSSAWSNAVVVKIGLWARIKDVFFFFFYKWVTFIINKVSNYKETLTKIKQKTINNLPKENNKMKTTEKKHNKIKLKFHLNPNSCKW